MGRSPVCRLRVDDPHASAEHAVLAWNGWRWEVRDLGSRNGTFVDGARIDAGVLVPLRLGARLAFGHPERVFAFVDDGPPSVMAIELGSGHVRTGGAGLLVLPDEDTPEWTVYPDPAGDWWAEGADGTARRLQGDERLPAAGQVWAIELPFVDESTPLARFELSIQRLAFRFSVSRDEEQVGITLMYPNMEIPLEPREHGYVLLTLARARAADRELAPERRGWRDREVLERQLRLDANALNVAIHRARAQLAAAGVSGAAGVVEVRRGQRRFGSDRFSIVADDS